MLDKQLNRRSFASILGAAAGSLGLMSSQSRLPAPWGSPGQGLVQSAGMNALSGPPNSPTPPLMPEWQATRLALKNPLFRDLITSQFYEEERRNNAPLDLDIAILRSFSPMAKRTFQRQRNVERQIEQSTHEPPWGLLEPVRKFVNDIVWGASS